MERAAPAAETGTTGWWALAGVTIAAVAASLNLYKVPPLIPVLAALFEISPADAGVLMSVYPLAGMLTSLPSAWLIRRIGAGHTVALGSLLCALGAAAGALSSTPGQLVLARFVEGMGLGFIIIAAIVVVAAWFPPARRGLPIGIFSTWLPLGAWLSLNSAPAIQAAFGWQAVWWLGAGAALAGVVFGELGAREAPPTPASTPPSGAVVVAGSRHWEMALGAARSPALVLAVAFGLFHTARMGFLTWAPTYLVGRGLPLAEASALAGLVTLVSIPLGVAAGGIVGSAGSARLATWLGSLLHAPLVAAVFFIPLEWAAPVLLVSGGIAAVVPTAVNMVAPETRRAHQSAGAAVAIVAFGRNVGMLAGPLLLGVSLQATDFNWTLVAWELAGASLLGAAFALLVPSARPAADRLG